PQSAVTHQLEWMQSEYGLTTDDAVLLHTSAAFDLSVWEFWLAPRTGAALVLAPEGAHRDPHGMLELIARAGVTTLTLVPSQLAMLTEVADGPLPAALRRLLVIGEPLPTETVDRTAARTGARLDNLYGPTEAAVSVTRYRTTAGETGAIVPIGVPEAGTRVYVLDDRLHPVPTGVTGELYLGGAQLATGYHGRPDLTAERFVADPFGEPGSRLYRTGDMVRWTADGQLVFVQRRDFQVKVRGYRIELAETEHALRACPAVAAGGGLAHDSGAAGAMLVGPYTVLDGHTLDADELRETLAQRLPGYMVPAALVPLAALPR